jgi:hypothetical protein
MEPVPYLKFVNVGALRNLICHVRQVSHGAILQIYSAIWDALIKEVVHHLGNVVMVLNLMQNLDFSARYISLEDVVFTKPLLNEYHTSGFWVIAFNFAYATVKTSTHRAKALNYCPLFSWFQSILYGEFLAKFGHRVGKYRSQSRLSGVVVSDSFGKNQALCC